MGQNKWLSRICITAAAVLLFVRIAGIGGAFAAEPIPEEELIRYASSKAAAAEAAGNSQQENNFGNEIAGNPAAGAEAGGQSSDNAAGASGTAGQEASGPKVSYTYEPITDLDKMKEVDVMTPSGVMSLYESDTTESEYLSRAAEQDAIFAEYSNIGIANVTDTLNIRKEPSQNASLVGRLPSNAVCNIVSEQDDWAYITSGEVEGYVKASYLATGADARRLAQDSIQTTATVHVSDGNLTVRMEPNENGPVLTAVANGEELEVEEALGKWVKINLDGNIAFVSADYVTIDKSLRTAMSISELIYGSGVNSIRAEICNYAQKFIGNPYVWGGTSLTKGADCSGFVQTIYATYGVSLPRVAAAQATVGRSVSLSDALPGDLVFYSSGGYIDHVGIYIGNGQIVNAASRRSGICIKAVGYRTVTKVTRVLPDL